MITRGTIYWADLGKARGSSPAKRRPVVVVSGDSYNRSKLRTTVAVVVTSNTDLASMPGNVFLPAGLSGLPRDSVANVTAVVTLDKSHLSDAVGTLPLALVREIDRGLRQSLQL